MADSTILFENVRVFDGFEVLGEQLSVLVSGKRISRIFQTAQEPQPELAAVKIDGTGCTLLPGLIDAHTHTRRPWGEHAILFGVTSELDLMSFPEAMLPLRQEASVNMQMSDIKSSSISCTVPGGWPTPLIQMGMLREFPTLSRVEDVAPFIRERVVNEKADIIKLLVDTRQWHDGLPTLNVEMVTEIVRVTHSYDKLAICHIHEHAAAIETVRHGVDGLAHLFLDEPHSPEFIQLCKEKGVFVIPTFGLLGAFSGICLSHDISNHPDVQNYASPGSIEALRRDASVWGYFKSDKKNIQWAWDAARALNQAGVVVLVGSDVSGDAGNATAHGVSVHHEMWMLVEECGFQPIEALRAATGRTAQVYKWDDRGTIEVGKLADLLLVDGDPTQDIRKTLDIRGIWRNGEKMAREVLRDKYRQPGYPGPQEAVLRCDH